MPDPFTTWSRIVAAGLDMQATWLRGFETLRASQAVVEARTDKMRNAFGVPPPADVAEFARMVPEKVDALGRSALAVTRDMAAIHGAWVAQVQRVGVMMTAGRPPTVMEMSALSARTADYALDTMTAGARLGRRALAPIHRTVTANARRLGKTG